MTKKEPIKQTTKKRAITVSSTAEYFSKNLQQVGFSSPTKAVLTTLKEAVDNSLDACEDDGILPEVKVIVEKVGAGSLKNTDKIKIYVEDNGPGIEPEDVPKVFGEYLASSKFGRGRCSRGQQGIGISAATTWAIQTNASGAKVTTKTENQRKAVKCVVGIDLKNNKGVLENKETIDWDKPHGTAVEFLIDGRLQLNGEAGLLNYLKANVLVNPHLTLSYKLPDCDEEVIPRVSETVPVIPEAVEPHPHTMKLGEFIEHGRLFGKIQVKKWLKTGFSRLSDQVIDELPRNGEFESALLTKQLDTLKDEDFKKLFNALHKTELRAPSTSSVLSIGEEGLAKSILRLGEIDFFAVVSRKPSICDYKPVQVEVAIARLKERIIPVEGQPNEEDYAQILRFANRVPLQFDKAGCAIVKAINTVNWRSYGLQQPKNSTPLGPYIIAVSVVSPFIKFKNASKETVDASDELVEEIRRALMMAGQRLSRHIKRENKEAELESKIQHIEKFAPILVEKLVAITEADDKRKERAEQGILKILGRDERAAKKEFKVADELLEEHLEEKRKKLNLDVDDQDAEEQPDEQELDQQNELSETEEEALEKPTSKKSKKRTKKK